VGDLPGHENLQEEHGSPFFYRNRSLLPDEGTSSGSAFNNNSAEYEREQFMMMRKDSNSGRDIVGYRRVWFFVPKHSGFGTMTGCGLDDPAQ
jgi:hypothetical protein